MGQEAGSHEGIHIAGIGAQFQIGHVSSHLGSLFRRLIADHHGICSRKGGITDIVELFQLHIREHADIDGVFHIDSAANAPGNIDTVNAVYGHVHALQKGVNGGINCALGTNEVVDVYLVDGNFTPGIALLRRCENVASHSVVIPLHSLAFPDEQASGIDDATAE